MDEEKIITNDTAEEETLLDDEDYEYTYEFVFEDSSPEEGDQMSDYRQAGIFDAASFFKDLGAALLGMVIGLIPAAIWLSAFGKTSPACYITIPICIALMMFVFKRRCDAKALWYVFGLSAFGIYLTEFSLVWYDLVQNGKALADTTYLLQRIFVRKLDISGYKSEPLYSAIFIIIGLVVSAELLSKRHLALNPERKSWLFANIDDDE